MVKVCGVFLALSLTLFPGCSILRAQDHGEDKTKASGDAEAAAGQAIFQQNCSFCHGRDARGASAPDLMRSTLVIHDVGGDLIGQIVHNGRVEKGMPAFQLADVDIQRIAAYLHQQMKLAATVASRVPTEYPLEQLLVGNADAGKTYFNGDGKCVMCHSPAGNLAHIANKYKPLELQSRIVFPDGTKATASVVDRSGHRFTGEVAYIDEFFVTLLSEGQPRTWDRHAVQVTIEDPLAAHVSLLTRYTDKDIHDLFAYLETLK